MPNRTCLALAICLAAPSFAAADGFFLQLPKDGAWVKYRMTNRLFGPSARESRREGELRISSVGTVRENGTECRWIEIRDENRHQDGRMAFVYVTKFLIPVAKLKDGHPAQADILRVWRKKNDADPELLQGPFKNEGMRYAIFFPGETVAADKPRQLEERTFTVNGDAMPTQAILQRRAFFKTGYKDVVDFRLWTHKKVPFGVAGAQIEWTQYRSDQLRFTFQRNYELIESGDGAKSELPNNN